MQVIEKQIGARKLIVLKSDDGAKNDCVIRSFAFAFFKDDYEEAKKFIQEKIYPEVGNGHGVPTHLLSGFLNSGGTINKKKVFRIEGEKGSLTELNKRVNTRTKEPCMYTVGAFLQDFPKGTYLLSVRKHLFVVKDGITVGNESDAQTLRKRVEEAWQIKWV